MNVLVLQSELGVLRGGGENFTRNLFSAFAERGHRVSASFIADCRSKYPIALPSGIEPIPLPGWWSRKLGQAALSSIGRFLPCGSRIRGEWDRVQEAICWRTIRWHDQRFERRVMSEFARRLNDFDAVYVHGNSALASQLARHRPAILRLPGPVTAELGPQLRSVHAVCANGDALLKIRSFLGEHATDLPVGLNTELFKPANTSVRHTLGWAKQDPVVGYVGRLTHLKGIDVLAAAFHQISSKISNAKLLIVGSGEEQQNIRADLGRELSARRVHIEADVTHERLPEWYRAMDLFVMPSRYENFSNAVLEAMACGVPFLVSDVGGNRILAQTGAGRVFESESPSALATRLSQILGNMDELKKRGKIGLDYVRDRYSWLATAERLERIFYSILEHRYD